MASEEVDSADGTPPEHHHVLSQRARLVTEQLLRSPQLLTDVEGAALGTPPWPGVVQVDVLLQQVDVAQLHQLHADVERQRDHHLQITGDTLTYTKHTPQTSQVLVSEIYLWKLQGTLNFKSIKLLFWKL